MAEDHCFTPPEQQLLALLEDAHPERRHREFKELLNRLIADNRQGLVRSISIKGIADADDLAQEVCLKAAAYLHAQLGDPRLANLTRGSERAKKIMRFERSRQLSFLSYLQAVAKFPALQARRGEGKQRKRFPAPPKDAEETPGLEPPSPMTSPEDRAIASLELTSLLEVNTLANSSRGTGQERPDSSGLLLVHLNAANDTGLLTLARIEQLAAGCGFSKGEVGAVRERFREVRPHRRIGKHEPVPALTKAEICRLVGVTERDGHRLRVEAQRHLITNLVPPSDRAP